MQLPWMGSKAEAVAKAIEGLGQRAEAISRDVVNIVRDQKEVKRVFPRTAWAVVNSTASLTVREALGSVPSAAEMPRIIETSLFANGRLGLISVEGRARNPNTLDLIAESYVLAGENNGLRAMMFETRDPLTWQAIGEGCGSATMIMSDARISMFAAPMAEIISQMQSTGLPDQGRILAGAVVVDGIGLSWSDYAVAPAVIVPVESDWCVRVSARAAAKISREVEQWPGVETGGIVMGRISEAAQTFYVADVLPAPRDSQRASHEFILGTAGARQMISDYSESCGYSLFCLGTWHSHLAASGASNTDRRTATAVGLARLAPSVLLIRTPAGFGALLADGSSSDQRTSEQKK